MKILTLMILGLMVVGCGKTEEFAAELRKSTKGAKCRYCGKMFPHQHIMGHQALCPKGSKRMMFDPTPEEVVGTYESNAYKIVFLASGIVEYYTNGKKEEEEYKWEIANGQIHFLGKLSGIIVHRINTDGSLTVIATIQDGKREDIPTEEQVIWKKIK